MKSLHVFRSWRLPVLLLVLTLAALYYSGARYQQPRWKASGVDATTVVHAGNAGNGLVPVFPSLILAN